MIEQLQKVLTVREARLRGLEADLARKRAALAEVDAELGEVDRELAQIASHRAMWESEWQHWLRKDRMVCHGQDHNLAHLALSAWERDARQVREEVYARKELAAEQARAARRALIAAQSRHGALRDEIEQRRRKLRLSAAARLDDRTSEEVAVRMRAVHPALHGAGVPQHGECCE